MKNEDPFSFNEIKKTINVSLGEPLWITATDGIRLAYYKKKTENPSAILIFYHGGGAYSGAGYQFLAQGLRDKYRINVYLADIRGHGNSEGRRGDTPSVIQVYKDIRTLFEFVRKENPGIPVYLGGHSSGAGLVLNYLSWNKEEEVKGYIFISPRLGDLSRTGRKNIKTPFAEVNMPVFALYRMSKGKMFGNYYAVKFNYPELVLKSQPLLIQSITCHMSTAITPYHPRDQFQHIEKPFGLFVGGNDELFIPERVLEFAELPGQLIKERSTSRVIKDQNHLSILSVSDQLIGETIEKING